jgi:hypothetical protein
MPDTDVAERFKRDTASHEMTVLHDDGLYRHLRFMRVITDETGRHPSSSYWFELVTWPGKLAVSGDCGSFLFARREDMFEFFRSDSRYGINPGYWSEKVLAGKTSGYSDTRFRQLVTEAAQEAEPQWPGLSADVGERFFGDLTEWNTEHEDGAREALRDFAFGDTWTASCACGESASGLDWAAAEAWRSGHITAANAMAAHRSNVARVEGFSFTGAWEWNLADFDWQFLWCCHAIQWGIGQYEAAKTSNGTASPTAGAS